MTRASKGTAGESSDRLGATKFPGRYTPTYWCEHRYPSGEYCPACGDIPDAYDGGMLVEEHEIDCQCFACTEEPDDHL